MALLSVAIGGAAGALARYGIVEFVKNLTRFEGWVAVLLANLGGCLVLGVIAAGGSGSADTGSTWRLLAGVGFCGSLTTMSALALDLTLLHAERRRLLGAAVLLGSWVGGLVAMRLGLWLGSGL